MASLEVTNRAMEMSGHLLDIFKILNVENATDFLVKLITNIHRKAYYSIIVMCSGVNFDEYEDAIYEEQRRGNTYSKIMPPPGLTEPDDVAPHPPAYDAETPEWMHPPRYEDLPGQKSRSRSSSMSSSTSPSIKNYRWPGSHTDEKSSVTESIKTKHVSLPLHKEPDVLTKTRERNQHKNSGAGYYLMSPIRSFSKWWNKKQNRG